MVGLSGRLSVCSQRSQGLGGDRVVSPLSTCTLEKKGKNYGSTTESRPDASLPAAVGRRIRLCITSVLALRDRCVSFIQMQPFALQAAENMTAETGGVGRRCKKRERLKIGASHSDDVKISSTLFFSRGGKRRVVEKKYVIISTPKNLTAQMFFFIIPL